MKRPLLVAVVALGIVLLASAGSLLAGLQVYELMTRVEPLCARRDGEAEYTPASYARPGFDTTPYLMPEYDTVVLPSREAGVIIHAFHIVGAAEGPSGPTVIIVHGNSDCRRRPLSLMPAAMLQRIGINALIIDLRNHGDSTVTMGHELGGVVERDDVLGGYDWLLAEHGVEPGRVGLFGYSLGGSIALMAGAAETGIAGVWTDGAYGDLSRVVAIRLTENGIPLFVETLALLAGRLRYGVDIEAVRPVDELRQLTGRPVQLVHSRIDTTVPYAEAEDLLAAGLGYGVDIDLWTLDDTVHVDTMFAYTTAYETRLSAFFTATLLTN